VNPWDSNGGGNYEFSRANDGKPAEAAAWARYLGATQTPVPVPVPPPPTPVPAAVTIGSGARTLALAVSEDAWQGDAQFTVSVDGKQVGGTQTATASHGAGQVQAFAVMGNFAAGGHTATVNFLNDAWGGTSTTDRNLYVSGAKIDGVSVPGAGLTLLSAGAQSFAFDAAAAPASGTDTLDIHLSEDAWQGDGRGSNQGNTHIENSLYHQSSIHFRCYLETALLNHAMAQLPALLLLHYFGGFARSWDAFAARLGPAWRCAAPSAALVGLGCDLGWRHTRRGRPDRRGDAAGRA